MTKEFINEVIQLSQLSVKEFAAEIYVNEQTVKRWMNGKSEPLFINQRLIRHCFKKEIRIINNKFNG